MLLWIRTFLFGGNMVKGKFWNILSIIVAILLVLTIGLVILSSYIDINGDLQYIFYNVLYFVLLPISTLSDLLSLTIDADTVIYVLAGLSLVWTILCILKATNKARILNMIFAILFAVWFGIIIESLISTGYYTASTFIPLSVFSVVGFISCFASIIVIAKNKGR